MAYCFSSIQSLPSPKSSFTNSHQNLISFGLGRIYGRRSSSPAVIKCGFNGLNAPLKLNSTAGKHLSTVFLNNDKECFDVAVKNQLELLTADRNQAFGLMSSTLGSDEAHLYRRISEVKERECQRAVEEIIYMLVLSKFSEIKVHLIPNVSKCISNSRLEICGPSKEWELKSIHNSDVLDMITNHLTSLVSWKANSSMTYLWETTRIKRLHLCGIYGASIMYGYFLKSVSLRYRLEQILLNSTLESLDEVHSSPSPSIKSHLSTPELVPMENFVFDYEELTRPLSTSIEEVINKHGTLKQYVMGLDQDMLKMCAKLKSKEALSVIERQTWALFGEIELGDEICTSFLSLKRFVLEGIAFGSFLWDSEEYVDGIYKLKENFLLNQRTKN